MKKILILAYLAVTAAAVNGQVLRSFTPRYSNASVRGNIVFVANNSITSAGIATNEVPPAGTAVNNGNTAANIDVTATTVIPFGASWKYWANTQANYQNNWQTTGYSDAAWPSGNGQLGYGDGDETTCVPSGGGGTLCVPTGTKYVTTYFRHTVNIPNPALFASLVLNVKRDDGMVVYVNGTEVWRNNMPAGAVAWATLASSAASDDGNGIQTLSLGTGSPFVAGNNLIAVEIHQNSATSSDLSFDLQLVGAEAGIFNATTADLSLPSCTQVLFAGLYWGATQGTDGTNTAWITGETAVKLKLPGSSSYTDLTSTQTDYHNGTLVPGLPHTGYRCFRDITSLVNTTSPNGTYTVANICSPAGIVNAAGGWTIVIAYSDPATITRNLTVFDGSAIMNGGDPALHIPITGFLTPPSGPVSCELGTVVFDGDRVSTDEYSFKQDSNPLVGSYTSLTPNTTANLNDMWNSTISYMGSVVTTRNPAHQNTLGYDADILTVPNVANAVLANNQTSASIRFSSPSENYMLQVATTSISQYTPSFNLSKTSTDVNGGSLLPGETLRYDISYLNGGNDASTATTIYDNIPAGTTYKPGSLLINGTAKTDAAGDDEAEYDFANNRVIFRLGTGAGSSSGGEINPGASGTVRFEVYTASSCLISSCFSTITNRARISYAGKISLLSLYDSSGVVVAGCNNPQPTSDIVTGSCSPLGDTILINTCPSLTVTLPVARYAGYRFYTGIPFTSGNVYDPANPVTYTRSFYAFYDGPGSCDDTISINVFIIACPDIDDDNDGLPDYLELNNAAAIQDADSDGILNWNDSSYPGYTDNNADNFNDNFDPSADSDNDGILNFYDTNFPGYADSNGDGVNDNMDKDLDGIPNHLDLDSDNDGIPDTVESFGVDANGDGRIDNYTDTDNDGFSQNVDANNTGVSGSNTGLGAIDTDSDGVANYLDSDSDNDGIPDVVEVYGTDVNNNGMEDGYADSDGDGYADPIDADVGNDNVAENSGAALLRTSADSNSDGRADTWPYKNSDADSKPNPYDVDSDGDGIIDTKEAGFTDTDFNGQIDGAINSKGWNAAVASGGSLSLPNTDGIGRPNVYDIDSDEDGIPDNVEGLSTAGYLLPADADTDNDGLDNTYDDIVGFSGRGIPPNDQDGDGTPDYLDSDTDNDGLIDRIEGNDLNLNGLQDDNVTLTGTDTDGDGLDDRFDNNNSSVESTSARMGNGGTTSGDPTPGSITTVQRTPVAFGCPSERDWRCIFYVLNCEIITFKASLQSNNVQLNWTALCQQEAEKFVVERSTDLLVFAEAATVAGKPVINETASYTAADNISSLAGDMFYYRLRIHLRSGKINYSNVIAVRRSAKQVTDVHILPNPVKDQLQVVLINTTSLRHADIYIMDGSGKTVQKYGERIVAGSNTFIYNQASSLPEGIYYLRVNIGEIILKKKFSVLK